MKEKRARTRDGMRGSMVVTGGFDSVVVESVESVVDDRREASR